MRQAWIVVAAAGLVLSACGSRNVKSSGDGMVDDGSADAGYGDIEVKTTPADEPTRKCYREVLRAVGYLAGGQWRLAPRPPVT